MTQHGREPPRPGGETLGDRIAWSRSTTHSKPAGDEQDDAQNRQGRNVSRGVSPKLGADNMRSGVQRGADADADERNGKRITRSGQGGQQEDCSQTNLERADVLEEVLVVRLESGERVEERTGADQCPRSEHDEKDPTNSGDQPRQTAAGLRRRAAHDHPHHFKQCERLARRAQLLVETTANRRRASAGSRPDGSGLEPWRDCDRRLEQYPRRTARVQSAAGTSRGLRNSETVRALLGTSRESTLIPDRSESNCSTSWHTSACSAAPILSQCRLPTAVGECLDSRQYLPSPVR